jgi:homoserine kinase type II
VPDIEQCAAVGRALAELHLAGADFGQRRANALSLGGWHRLVEQIGPAADQLEPGLATEIARALDELEGCWPIGLPQGIIHADLFPDNVLFLDERLSGLIDFYFSCSDALAYDVAVVLNSWCFDPSHSFVRPKSAAFLNAYHERRPLSAVEGESLAVLARGSALRFLLTRLYDYLNRQPNALVRIKDPHEYLTKLRFHGGMRNAADYGLIL